MAGDFLFTWKPEHWPYEKLRNLVDRFEAGEEPQQFWRCGAYRMVSPGDKAYLFRQGKPRGVFGIGTVTGPVMHNKGASEGENPYSVPLSFQYLVDPTLTFLVEEAELLGMPQQSTRLTTQKSGVSFEEGVARAIDTVVEQKSIGLPTPLAASADFVPLSMADGRRRTMRSILLRRGQRQFRDQLFVAYGGKCCVTGCDIPELLEAAHIVPYRGDETNRTDNGLLLRSDIHTLFDCGLVNIDSLTMKLKVSPNLNKSGYWKLQERLIKLPTNKKDRPSFVALKFREGLWAV